MIGLAMARRYSTYAIWGLVLILAGASFVYWYQYQHGRVGHPVDMSILPGTSEFQSEMLKDGFVSRSEYRNAHQKYADCLRDSGIKTRGPIDILRPGFVVVNYHIAENDAGAWAKQAACEAEYTSVVNGVYFTQAIPQGEEIGVEKEATIRCLQKAGAESVHSATPLASIAAGYFDGRMTYDEGMCIHLHLPLLYVENIQDY